LKKKKIVHLNSIVSFLRNIRKLHRVLGLSICLLVIISATTGILLSYKKQAEWIQPPTQSGKSAQTEQFISIDSIHKVGIKQVIGLKNTITIDRIDIRPEKGIAKILYKDVNWEMQIDISTGKVLSQKARYSDLIERIHDGSFISESFKLGSMTYLGLGLLILTFSGLGLWYGPKVIRNKK
jgi:uncharacterized iron-regulated membrane protein